MKHIQVVAYCDGLAHAAVHGGERVRSTIERTISIDGSKDVVLDLCETCDEQVQAMQALMEQGSAVEKEKRKPGRPPSAASIRTPSKSRDSGMPTTCPECGWHSPTRSALGQHVKKHQKQLKDYTDAQYERAEQQYATSA